MRMRNPPHPGEILKEDVLPELGLTVGQLAEHLRKWGQILMALG